MRYKNTIAKICRCFLASSLFTTPTSIWAESLLTGEIMLTNINQKINNINTKQLQEMLKKDPHTYVIDVRTPEEIVVLGGRIKSSMSFNIPRGWLEFRVADRIPDKDTPIVVYCGINQRSPLAADTLIKMGYTNVYNYSDGFFEWSKQGLPILSHDKALNSALYSLPQKVTDGVWSAIGATLPPTYANSGHNNNLSFVITDEGVVLINAGENYLLAQAMHAEIRKITDKPIKYLIWENGQGHAAGGSKYWKERGVHIIAQEQAAHELSTRGEQIMQRMQSRRDKIAGTELVPPDETFTDKKVLELGGQRIEVLNLGPAHSPGDTQVWLPQKKLLIAGDIAFHERMPAIFEHSDTAGWVDTWSKLEELDPEIVIPGHGSPTTLDEVAKYTRDYLLDVRGQVGTLLDEGGSLEDVYKIDQSAYSHLNTYHELHGLNASIIFRAMEFE